LNFPPKTVNNFFKFSAQDSDLEYLCCKNCPVSSDLKPALVTFPQDPMYLAGCQINQIYVNFYLQKSLKIIDENSADKIQSKKEKGIKKCPPS